MHECDDEVGCLLPTKTASVSHLPQITPHVDIIFVTDPICSHCWAIEPMWRRLQLNFNFSYRYIHGGLLPGWQNFTDAGNGITKPSDVAQHWQQVADHFKQPIDSSIWLKDPLSNSVILCKALLVIRLLLPEQETAFLRKMREYIFLYAINLAKEVYLLNLVEEFGVNLQDFQQLLYDESIHQLFINEQQEMMQRGAQGFPSLIMTANKTHVISGAQAYSVLEQKLLQTYPTITLKKLSIKEKIMSYPSWTLREASEVLQCSDAQAKARLLAEGFKAKKIASTIIFIKT